MPDTSDATATQVRHECYTNNTSATQVRHKYYTNNTSATQVRHKYYTNNTSATRVKNSGFDSDTSKNIFLHPYVYYMVSERLQREEQFHSKNYLLEMPCFHAKMHLKKCTTKTRLFNDKSYITKLYTRL